MDNVKLVYKSNERVHPEKLGTLYNKTLWGYKNFETGNVFDTREEAEKDKKPVKRAAKKTASKE